MWTTLADDETVEKTIQSLKANGITAMIVDSGEQAKAEVLKRIPRGAQVFTMSSETLRVTGIADAINTDQYISVRKRLISMNHETQGNEMRILGAAPEWAIGSVHAVTEDGLLMIASKTGSQLAAYVSGAAHVIFVIGTQKIVGNRDEGFKRMYEHSLKMENVRALKVYGMESEIDKILLIAKEFKPGRTTVIFVKEVLGF